MKSLFRYNPVHEKREVINLENLTTVRPKGEKKLAFQLVSNLGGIVEIYVRDLGNGWQQFSALWIRDFAHPRSAAIPTKSLERVLKRLFAAGHQLKELTDLADYPLYAKTSNGKIVSVSLWSSDYYTKPLLAKDVPAGTRLNRGALDFFHHWKGPSAIIVSNSTLRLGAVPIEPEFIIKIVADHTDISTDEIRGRSKKKLVSEARHITMYLLRHDARLQLKQIGFLLGRRDHSSVIHGVQKIERLLATDNQLHEKISYLRALALKAISSEASL